MTPGPPDLPWELRRFAELFNGEAFWESHEVLEGPWREDGSEFYHGLILYASAFVHVQRDNPHGVMAQLRKAERALEPFLPAYLGVDVAAVVERCRRVRARVEEARDDPPRRWADRIALPRLELDARWVRGDEPEL